MSPEILDMALLALENLFNTQRMAFLLLGVVCGLMLGVIPGLGGLIGLTLLLPLTFDMDPYTGLAFLMGLSAVSATSDSIPAILFGVPGTVASAATVVDGHPMARNGEAGRALGAAFTASVIGGLFGAIILFFATPVLRSAILSIAKPEMLAVVIFGISLAATLSGKYLGRGLLIAIFGLLLGTVGQSKSGDLRWTLDSLYLYGGFHIVPVTLGLFAIPEIFDMLLSRQSIATKKVDHISVSDQMLGARDAIKNWFLVLRCSAIGAGLGAIPGIGATIIDWVAYGHAYKTCKGADKTFGTGDVRGVLASEASNNAKEGGSLVPTIAFGVPGSASMALILAALLMQGIVPGPDMLGPKLDVTYTLVWSIAIANVFGALICLMLANQFAKLATVKIELLGPLVLTVIVIGAFQGSNQWGDLGVLLFFAVIGLILKRLEWPRPPIILGVVLSTILEDNAFIVANVYGWDWLARPIALSIVLLTFASLFTKPILKVLKSSLKTQDQTHSRATYQFTIQSSEIPHAIVLISLIALFTYALGSMGDWDFRSSLLPETLSLLGLILGACLFAALFVHKSEMPTTKNTSSLDKHTGDLPAVAHLQYVMNLSPIMMWLGGYICSALVIGLLPASSIALGIFLKIYSRYSWPKVAAITLLMSAFCYSIFHLVLEVSWAYSLLGDSFPQLRSIPFLNIL